MSKGDFELLSAALLRSKPPRFASLSESDRWSATVHEIANTLDDHFLRFDVNRFLKACGAEVEPVEA